jgi:hypothetical protein
MGKHLNTPLSEAVGVALTLRSMTSKIAALLFFLLSALQAQALGRVVGYEEIWDYHPASIRQIMSCGSWSKGEGHGEFRVIQAQLYGQDMLFVDWVRSEDHGAHWAVEQGLSIAEFNNDHAEISLRGLRCIPAGEGRVRVLGEAENGHDEQRFRFELLVNAKTGRYTLKQNLPRKP